jgi:hypothetical protein
MLQALFVLLNLLDAWLNTRAAEIGAVEVNPVLILLGGSLLWRGLIAVGIVVLLRLLGKEQLLLPFCLAVASITAWNVGTYYLMLLMKT